MKPMLEAISVLLKMPGAEKDATIQAALEFQKAVVAGQLFPEMAEAGLRKASELLSQSLGSDHVYLALIHAEHAGSLLKLGRNKEAIRKFEESLAIVRKTVGYSHPRVCVMIYHNCDLLIDEGQPDMAWELAKACTEDAKARYPDEFRWQHAPHAWAQ
jgi:tetratricopeptide (TPR) repeat protein